MGCESLSSAAISEGDGAITISAGRCTIEAHVPGGRGARKLHNPFTAESLPDARRTGVELGGETHAMGQHAPCRKCGSASTRMVGQSTTPAGVIVKCDGCGHSSLVVGEAPPPQDVETRRVERLVHLVVSDKRLACQVQTVARVREGWQVTVLGGRGQRNVVRFDVKAGTLGVMRSSIEHGLAPFAS